MRLFGRPNGDAQDILLRAGGEANQLHHLAQWQRATWGKYAQSLKNPSELPGFVGDRSTPARPAILNLPDGGTGPRLSGVSVSVA